MNDMAPDDIPQSPEPEPKLLSPDLIDELAVDAPVTPEKKEQISKSVIRTSNRKVQAKARYLSPSTGSCHDYCKYGHKNLKENMSSFIAKQIKKKLVVNPKPLFKPSEETLNQVPRKKIERFSKPSLSPAKPMIKRSTSFSTQDAKIYKKCNDVVLKKGVGIIQVNPMGDHLNKGKKKEIVTSHALLSPKRSIKRVLSGKSQIVKDPKEVSHLKRLSSVPKPEKKEKQSGDGNKIQGSEQTPYFENKKGKQKPPDAVTVRPSLVSGRKSSAPNGDQNASSKTMKGHDETKTQKQMLKKKVELNSGSKNVDKKTRLEEKNDMAYKLGFKRGKVVDVKTKNTAPRRLKFKPRNIVSEELNSKADDMAVAGLKSAPAKQTTNHKMGSNGRLRRVGKAGIEGKNEKSAYKLNFERGKVIDVQPKNTVPRRLKFKPRKVVAENLKSDYSRRNLKKVVGSDEVNGLNAEHLRVVLKHQNVEGKKHVESLLNNVIEETATRLVRLRKSKVKALVGAFESLMSLPDARSSTPSAS